MVTELTAVNEWDKDRAARADAHELYRDLKEAGRIGGAEEGWGAITRRATCASGGCLAPTSVVLTFAEPVGPNNFNRRLEYPPYAVA